MVKYLLISGSPRHGNTDFILEKIFGSLPENKKLIYLRDKEIRHCTGCLNCIESDRCSIHDDMDDIYIQMLDSDIIIIGTPNYFDNVTGLLKDFIDRTNPFHDTDMLKGKKMISIVVGGGKTINSKRIADQALTYFAECHNLELIESYIFKALKADEVQQDEGALRVVDEIVGKITSLSCS